MTTHKKVWSVALRGDRFTVTSLMLLFLGSASAYGQVIGSFDGCGEMRMTGGVEQCLAFFADTGEYPRGLLPRGGAWAGVQVGDRIDASGLVIGCGSFCIISGCFDENSTIQVCTTPPIPAVSTWGLVVLAFLFAVAAAVVMRNRNGYRPLMRVFAVLPLLIVNVSAFAQPDPVASKINRMLQHSHHPQRLFVRFEGGTSQAARDALHASAGAVVPKTYGFVPDLTVVSVASGDLSNALTTYLSDPNVLYAEPDGIGQATGVPNDTDFGLL